MDYEKKYKEALEKAKDALSDGTISSNTIAYLQDIFPELKESEDERIREALIDYFDDANKADENPLQSYGIHTDKVIAWLEKQKEFVSADFDDVWETADCDELTAPLEKYSKDAIKKMCHAWYDKGIELERRNWLKKQDEHANFLSKIQVGDKVTRNEGGVLVNISQLERVAKPRRVKPVDKVEPKFHEGDWDAEKKELKKIEQKLIEWSEEDEEMFDAIIADIQFTQKAHIHEVNQVVYEREIDWLKSIRQKMGG